MEQGCEMLSPGQDMALALLNSQQLGVWSTLSQMALEHRWGGVGLVMLHP